MKLKISELNFIFKNKEDGCVKVVLDPSNYFLFINVNAKRLIKLDKILILLAVHFCNKLTEILIIYLPSNQATGMVNAMRIYINVIRFNDSKICIS